VLFQHLVSWGFIVACTESNLTGSGNECIEGLDAVYKLYPQLADNKIASMGHSQGGGGAITCTYLAEQKWGSAMKVIGFAIAPSYTQGYGGVYPLLKAHQFILSGSLDTAATDATIRAGYDLLKTETVWFQAIGMNHDSFHEQAKVNAAAYFRWKLVDDYKGQQYMLDLLTNPTYKRVAAKKQ
jgi:hypothetical protein